MDATGNKKSIRLQAEIADSPLKHQQGLMGRKHLPKHCGMLFDFGKEQELSFWMQHTYLPLQIAFIAKDGTIGQIEKMTPLSTRAVRSAGKYRYALEVRDGWFDEFNIKVGQAVGVPPTAMGQPQQGQPPQQQGSANAPNVQVVQSYKEILKRADDRNVPVVIDYVTDEGLNIVPALIEPPFEFIASKDGDPEGRVLAYNFQNVSYGNDKQVSKTNREMTGRKSYLIENIQSVRDAQSRFEITNVQQIDGLANKQPLTERDEARAKGIAAKGKE